MSMGPRCSITKHGSCIYPRSKQDVIHAKLPMTGWVTPCPPGIYEVVQWQQDYADFCKIQPIPGIRQANVSLLYQQLRLFTYWNIALQWRKGNPLSCGNACWLAYFLGTRYYGNLTASIQRPTSSATNPHSPWTRKRCSIITWSSVAWQHYYNYARGRAMQDKGTAHSGSTTNDCAHIALCHAQCLTHDGIYLYGY